MPHTHLHSHLSNGKLPAGNFSKFGVKTPIELTLDACKRGAQNG